MIRFIASNVRRFYGDIGARNDQAEFHLNMGIADNDFGAAATVPAELLQKALALSDEERAELAGSLIDSLDAKADERAESAWNQEIVRRIEDLDSGKAKTVPWDEVRRRISTKLTHGK